MPILKVGIDLVSPLPQLGRGNRYIVTIVDYFSKWPAAEEPPDKSAKSVALFLYKMMCKYVLNASVLVSQLPIVNDLYRYGCTKVVISDWGREFMNHASHNLLTITKTEHRIFSAHHPQSSGLVERFNQTFRDPWSNLSTAVRVTGMDEVLFAYCAS